MADQSVLRAHTIAMGKKISAEISKLNRRDPNYAQKVRAIQSKYKFGTAQRVKLVEQHYGTRSLEFDKMGKHLSRRGVAGLKLIKEREAQARKLKSKAARDQRVSQLRTARKRKLTELKARRQARLAAQREQNRAAKTMKSQSTDMVSLASKFLQFAVSAKPAKSIKSGDKLLKDNFTKYNQLVKSSINEMNGLGLTGGAVSTQALGELKQPNTQLKNVLDTASPMFAGAKNQKTAVAIKLVSGLVTAVGGDPRIGEVLTFIVNRRYPSDIENIYKAVVKKQWLPLAGVLIQLMQKIWEDQDLIMEVIAEVVGKEATNDFVRKWKQKQVPFVGWTLLAANLINVIKGVMTPSLTQ